MDILDNDIIHIREGQAPQSIAVQIQIILPVNGKHIHASPVPTGQRRYVMSAASLLLSRLHAGDGHIPCKPVRISSTNCIECCLHGWIVIVRQIATDKETVTAKINQQVQDAYKDTANFFSRIFAFIGGITYL